jgi:hypothetical protein
VKTRPFHDKTALTGWGADLAYGFVTRMPKPMASCSSRVRNVVTIAFLSCAIGVTAVGCTNDEEHTVVDTTMNADGYALFAVDNDRQQRNDLSIVVRDVDPGATYVLLYSDKAPTNVGWFLFDPNDKTRCGGDIGPHCEVAGYGYMVDVLKVREGTKEITLRDGRCGCDADRYRSSWTGHWAVMRVERTNRTNPVTVDVWAKRVKDYAVEPEVKQLQ